MESVLSQKSNFNKLPISFPNANIETPMDVFNAKKIFTWDWTENVTPLRLDAFHTLKVNA